MADKLTYNVEEAAEALGVGRTTIYDLMDTGQLENIKVGRRRLVPADALKAYVQRRREQ